MKLTAKVSHTIKKDVKLKCDTWREVYMVCVCVCVCFVLWHILILSLMTICADRDGDTWRFVNYTQVVFD